MFTHKDIEYKSIFVVNCLDKKHLRVKSGELLLEDSTTGKTLTKFPFQKVLALFIIGHITITSPLIEKCRQNGIFVCVMKGNLRPVFTFGVESEANFLLREKQFSHDANDLRIACQLAKNKISNQVKLLRNTRRSDLITKEAIETCEQVNEIINPRISLTEMMGYEGAAAKEFFQAYFKDYQWHQRQPRIKCDYINVILDIGYTILFNFIETFLRLFGFDLYIGVYHRNWFKRKSLVCDIVEPFRCIIDQQVRKSLNLKQFCDDDFRLNKNEYYLKHEKCSDYYNLFFQSLVNHKKDIFSYIQQYYRAFMSGNKQFPNFYI